VSLINFRHGPRSKHRIYYYSVFSANCIAKSTARTTENIAFPIFAHSLGRNVFTGPLPNNGCPPIVGCALVGTCLPSNGVSWPRSLMLWANPSQYECKKQVTYFLVLCRAEALEPDESSGVHECVRSS
jgi:hypothetical protein